MKWPPSPGWSAVAGAEPCDCAISERPTPSKPARSSGRRTALRSGRGWKGLFPKGVWWQTDNGHTPWADGPEYSWPPDGWGDDDDEPDPQRTRDSDVGDSLLYYCSGPELLVAIDEVAFIVEPIVGNQRLQSQREELTEQGYFMSGNGWKWLMPLASNYLTLEVEGGSSFSDPTLGLTAFRSAPLTVEYGLAKEMETLRSWARSPISPTKVSSPWLWAWVQLLSPKETEPLIVEGGYEEWAPETPTPWADQQGPVLQLGFLPYVVSMSRKREDGSQVWRFFAGTSVGGHVWPIPKSYKGFNLQDFWAFGGQDPDSVGGVPANACGAPEDWYTAFGDTGGDLGPAGAFYRNAMLANSASAFRHVVWSGGPEGARLQAVAQYLGEDDVAAIPCRGDETLWSEEMPGTTSRFGAMCSVVVELDPDEVAGRDSASLRALAFERAFGRRVLVQSVMHYDSYDTKTQRENSCSLVVRRCFTVSDVMDWSQYSAIVYSGLLKALQAGVGSNELAILQMVTANAVQDATTIAKWVEFYNGTRPSSPDSSAYIDAEP